MSNNVISFEVPCQWILTVSLTDNQNDNYIKILITISELKHQIRQ